MIYKHNTTKTEIHSVVATIYECLFCGHWKPSKTEKCKCNAFSEVKPIKVVIVKLPELNSVAATNQEDSK